MYYFFKLKDSLWIFLIFYFRFRPQVFSPEYFALIYGQQVEELACIGAGIGGGFNNTAELHVMKYNQAMQTPDRDKWKKAVQDEYY